jgi:hypothetical protein
MWTLIRKSSEEPPPNVGVLLMKKAIFGHTTRPGVQAAFVSKAYCPPGNIMGIS